MPGIPGCAPRRYSHEEKVALVTEIDRRHRERGGPLRAIAAELGTTDTSYLNWRRSGIEPLAEPKKQPNRRAYPQEERKRLLAEVEHLLEEGKTLAEACRVAGVSDESYRRWKLDAHPVIRPVEVTALVPIIPDSRRSSPETLTLTTPGGYRLEGLNIESAAELLRALS